LKRPL